MQADLPHTLYMKDRASGKETCKERAGRHTKASDEVIRLQEEANRRMAERRAEKEKERKDTDGDRPMTVEELFSKRQ